MNPDIFMTLQMDFSFIKIDKNTSFYFCQSSDPR